MLGVETRGDCKEFAVIAFWDHHKTDVFECKRFFIVPSPVKRIIKDSNGTLVYEVLFTSPHTNDVFFFFRGVDMEVYNTIETQGEMIENVLQVGFL